MRVYVILFVRQWWTQINELRTHKKGTLYAIVAHLFHIHIIIGNLLRFFSLFCCSLAHSCRRAHAHARQCIYVCILYILATCILFVCDKALACVFIKIERYDRAKDCILYILCVSVALCIPIVVPMRIYLCAFIYAQSYIWLHRYDIHQGSRFVSQH